jgi:hypothetical protein
MMDYELFKQQRQMLGNFIERNYKAVSDTSTAIQLGDTPRVVVILPSEYEAMEGIDNLLSAIADLFEPEDGETE